MLLETVEQLLPMGLEEVRVHPKLVAEQCHPHGTGFGGMKDARLRELWILLLLRAAEARQPLIGFKSLQGSQERPMNEAV